MLLDFEQTKIPSNELSIVDDEKGQKFLELIDKQNTVQLAIIQNLSVLIKTSWLDEKLKAKLESLMLEHYSISSQLNELDS